MGIDFWGSMQALSPAGPLGGGTGQAGQSFGLGPQGIGNSQMMGGQNPMQQMQQMMLMMMMIIMKLMQSMQGQQQQPNHHQNQHQHQQNQPVAAASASAGPGGASAAASAGGPGGASAAASAGPGGAAAAASTGGGGQPVNSFDPLQNSHKVGGQHFCQCDNQDMRGNLEQFLGAGYGQRFA